MQRKLQKDLTIIRISVLTLLGGATNYLFHILVARSLGPIKYGEVATTLGIMSIITTSGIVFQTSASKQTVISLDNSPRMGIDQFSRNLTRGAIFTFLTVLLLSPLLANFLHLSPLLFLPVALFSFPALHESLATGRLQGMNRYETTAIYSFVQSLAKLCAIGVSVAIGASTFGLISIIVVFATLIVIHEIRKTSHGPAIQMAFTDSVILKQLFVVVMILITQSLDVPLARFSLGELEAGKFVAASQLGKITLVLPFMLAQFAFPQLVKDSLSGVRTTFNRVIMEILLASTAVSLTLILFHETIVSIILGNEFASSSAVTWQMSLAFTPLSLANLFLLDCVAKGRIRHYMHVGLAPIILIVMVIIFPGNISMLVASCFISTLLFLFLTLRISHD